MSANRKMKFLLSFSFLLICFNGQCQLRCVDIVERFDPSPHKLLNDSLSNLATSEQIEELRSEQNLIFTFNVELGTGKITQIKMNYFFEPVFREDEEPLDPKLIELLESFYTRNIKIIFNEAYSGLRDSIVKCAFTAYVEVDSVGIDDNPRLNHKEAELLDSILEESFDFKDKKIAFITESSGSMILGKSDFFERCIKPWTSKGAKPQIFIVQLNEMEKNESGGYDVLALAWVKLFTDKRKQKIIKQLE